MRYTRNHTSLKVAPCIVSLHIPTTASRDPSTLQHDDEMTKYSKYTATHRSILSSFLMYYTMTFSHVRTPRIPTENFRCIPSTSNLHARCSLTHSLSFYRKKKETVSPLSSIFAHGRVLFDNFYQFG